MDLKISELMEMQRSLYELHREEWMARVPESGKEHILYMIEEIGETIAILKKKGNDAVVSDPQVRTAFLEELADVLMYYTEVLRCYHISPEEISRAFSAKYEKNMGRNYAAEYKELYHGQE